MGSALAGLGVLALAAAAVSFTAQYRLVFAANHLAPIAALEAGIPDVGSMIFACLGIALAMHGKRAIRARALNVACVGLSLGMNALAAAPGPSLSDSHETSGTYEISVAKQGETGPLRL
jgi:hypothetical protein